jgi:hypothetical protein
MQYINLKYNKFTTIILLKMMIKKNIKQEMKKALLAERLIKINLKL